jgi:hypothetical protein
MQFANISLHHAVTNFAICRATMLSAKNRAPQITCNSVMRNLDHACLQPIQLLGSLITYNRSLYLALFIILLLLAL